MVTLRPHSVVLLGLPIWLMRMVPCECTCPPLRMPPPLSVTSPLAQPEMLAWLAPDRVMLPATAMFSKPVGLVTPSEPPVMLRSPLNTIGAAGIVAHTGEVGVPPPPGVTSYNTSTVALVVVDPLPASAVIVAAT